MALKAEKGVFLGRERLIGMGKIHGITVQAQWIQQGKSCEASWESKQTFCKPSR